MLQINQLMDSILSKKNINDHLSIKYHLYGCLYDFIANQRFSQLLKMAEGSRASSAKVRRPAKEISNEN